MLSHLEYVDVIFIKRDTDKKNNLIKLVKPDVLVLSETTKHKPTKNEEVGKYVKSIKVLSAQAETSTTARIRLLHVNGKKDLIEILTKEIPEFIKKFL
jgi:glycerol-3-phosphate cytidylyltransferase-like family protein